MTAATAPAAITLAQVIERFEPALRQRYGERLLPSHHQALTAMKRCRTRFGTYSAPPPSEARRGALGM